MFRSQQTHDATARLFRDAQIDFSERYVVKEELGKGKATVFKAVRNEDGASVAVKTFDKTARTASISGIVNEVELLQLLRGAPHSTHFLPLDLTPQVVELIELYEDQETVQAVLDLCAVFS